MIDDDPALFQKVLELKSNIQKPSDEPTFVKPLPPSLPISGPARGIKRSHDVGELFKSVCR